MKSPITLGKILGPYGILMRGISGMSRTFIGIISLVWDISTSWEQQPHHWDLEDFKFIGPLPGTLWGWILITMYCHSSLFYDCLLCHISWLMHINIVNLAVVKYLSIGPFYLFKIVFLQLYFQITYSLW